MLVCSFFETEGRPEDPSHPAPWKESHGDTPRSGNPDVCARDAGQGDRPSDSVASRICAPTYSTVRHRRAPVV